MRRLSTANQPGVLSSEDVEALVARLRAFSGGTPTVLLYLHGAHAQGRQSALSDIDIAVLMEGSVAGSPEAQLDLLAAFAVALGGLCDEPPAGPAQPAQHP